MAAAPLCGLYRATFSLKYQDFRDPNQNSDPTDQWGIAFFLSKAVRLRLFGLLNRTICMIRVVLLPL